MAMLSVTKLHLKLMTLAVFFCQVLRKKKLAHQEKNCLNIKEFTILSIYYIRFSKKYEFNLKTAYQKKRLE